MVNELRLDRTLEGLADPTRRAIVAGLAAGPRTFGDLASDFPISRPAVSRHLRVLRRVGLVREERVPYDGRVRLYSLHPEPLRSLDRWIDQVTGFWEQQLGAFREAAEELRRERSQEKER
jgi:DNA-binding transcriptional ArsR family regulator